MTRPDQGLSSLAQGGKMRDPGNEVACIAIAFVGNVARIRGQQQGQEGRV